jgi:hypothetical protein
LAYAAGVASGVVAGLYSIGAGFGDWMFTQVMKEVAGITGYVGERVESATRVVENLYQRGEQFANWALSPVLSTIADVSEYVDSKVQQVNQALGRLYDFGVQIGLITISPFVKAFDAGKRAVEGMRDAVSDLLGMLPDLPVLPFGGENDTPEQHTVRGFDKEDAARESGKAAAKGFAEGSRDGRGIVTSAWEGIMQSVSSYMPSSDAERGPLSNLTAMGKALPGTFALGIEGQSGIAINAISNMVASLHNEIPGSLPTPGLGGDTSSVGADITAALDGGFPQPIANVGVSPTIPTKTDVVPPPPPSGDFPSADEIGRAIAKHGGREGDTKLDITNKNNLTTSLNEQRLRKIVSDIGVDTGQVDSILSQIISRSRVGPKPGKGY